MSLRIPSALAAFVALALCAPAHAADAPLGALPDLAGPRTLGLSATVGTASGNEGLYVNPAAIAARKRYSVELGGGVERSGDVNDGEVLSGSVVDAITSPVAAGLAWARVFEGGYQGTVATLALAGELSSGLQAGVSGKWLSLDGPHHVGAVTMDAGLLWQVGEWVSLGAAGYNLVPIENPAVAPRTVAAGAAVGNDRLAQVTFEWGRDLDAQPSKDRWAAGAEVLVMRQFPLRAGYLRDDLTRTRWWSAGAGVVQGRVGFDVGYRQDVDHPSVRSIYTSLKFYFVE